MKQHHLILLFLFLFSAPTTTVAQSGAKIREALATQDCVDAEVKVCKYDYIVDGFSIEAVSFRPAGSDQFPGVLLIPGYQRTALDLIPLGVSLAKAGFAGVAVTQPSFGKSQGKADYVGPFTLKVLTEGFRKLKRERYVDADRMGIYGYSRGGMAASLLAVKLTDVRAAVFGAGIYDFQKAHDGVKIEGIRANMESETGMTEAAVRERSSIFQMEKLKAPVLILHGEKDENVPVSQAYLLRDRLTALKKDFEIKLYPDKQHSIGAEEVATATIDFFKRRLGRKTAHASARTQAVRPLNEILFDDFSYTNHARLKKNGWILRTEPGWPGVPGATWSEKGITLLKHPDQPNNTIIRMTSSTDGTGANTTQTQICHQRKYLEGTYAARVRFTDNPVSGPGGDQLVESFYTISPLKAAMDPDYSELDFEYLPNGGWGIDGPTLYATTWETFSPEPNWKKDNVFKTTGGSQAGWHTLVMQVTDQKVRYFVDGKFFVEHNGNYYPEDTMSINFNLWFIRDGMAKVTGVRKYQEDIDWVFHQTRVALTPEQVEAVVADL